jgi:ABC-type glycerol-3-phosphate transport system substrate-binding protein
MKKMCFVFFVLAVLTLPLYAGGGRSDAASSPGQGAAKPVELTFWYYPVFESAEDVLGDELAAKVNKLYPNIRVNHEIQSWDAGPERFTLALASGQTPDVIHDTYSRLGAAVNAGLTLDLTDVVQQITPYINPPARHKGTVNGRNMAIDMDMSWGYIINVNQTLLKKLGVYGMLPEDRLHWSYDQFLDLCRAIKKADPDVIPIDLYAGSRSSDAWYYSWVLGSGSDILNAEHTAVVVDNDKALKTITLLKTLIDEKLAPPGAATLVDIDGEPSFKAQKIAMFHGAFNAATLITDTMLKGEIDTFEFDSVAIPTPDGKADPRVASFGGGSFVAFKKDGDPERIDGIKKFLVTVYSSPEILRKWSAGAGTPLIIKNTEAKMQTPWLDQLLAWNIDYTLKYSTSSFGILEPWWTSFREAFYPQLQELYIGRATPKQVLENWTKNGNAIIADALKQKSTTSP